MRWALAIAASAGCLGRPTPHGMLGDAQDGDGAQIDASRCAWQGPVSIPLPSLALNDSATSPWLSDDRTDLWFTQLPESFPLHASILEVTNTNGTWNMPALRFGDSTESFDNAFLGNGKVWFDVQPNTGTGTRYIDQSPPVTSHFEIANAEQPALTSDGANIYFARTGTNDIDFGSIISDQITVLSTFVNPTDVAFESPSVSRDGATLYVTGKEAGGKYLYVATPKAGTTEYTTHARIPGFQVPGSDYFDPNISTDGATLVFASNFEGGAPRIYYVTRPPDCSP